MTPPLRVEGNAPTRPLMRQAGIYTATGLVSRAIPFFLLPLLTRFLSPEDFGVVSMFLMVVLILEPFVGLGLSGSITVRYFDPKTQLSAYIATGVAMTVVSAGAAGIGLLLVREPLGAILAIPSEWLVVAALLVLVRVLSAIPLTLLRLQERPLTFGAVQTAQSLGLLSAIGLFVVVLHTGWEGRVAAELVAWAVVGFVGFVVLKPDGVPPVSVAVKHALAIGRFGVPLIPHTLGALLILQTPRFLLTNMVGVEATGLYTAAFQLAGPIELVALSFNLAYAPWLLRQLVTADETTKVRLVRLTYKLFCGMALFAVVVAVAMPPVADLLLDPSFAESSEYVSWLALAFLFSAMYYMVANYIFFVQKTYWLAAVTMAVALLNIPLTYALVSLNGTMGAAQATALALGMSCVATWIVSQRVYPMPWFMRSAAPSP